MTEKPSDPNVMLLVYRGGGPRDGQSMPYPAPVAPDQIAIAHLDRVDIIGNDGEAILSPITKVGAYVYRHVETGVGEDGVVWHAYDYQGYREGR